MMNFLSISIAAPLAAAVCLLATPVMAADAGGSAVRVTGEKVDSGLGDLPHYSKWADPTGKNPMQARTAVDTKQAEAAAAPDAKQHKPAAVHVSQSR